MNGSQMNLDEWITEEFFKCSEIWSDMYCKYDQSLLRLWSTVLPACMNVLKEAGYKEPTFYYVCLNESQYNE